MKKKRYMANVWNIILSTVIQVIWYNYLVLATRFAAEIQYTRCKSCDIIHLSLLISHWLHDTSTFRWLVRKKRYGYLLFLQKAHVKTKQVNWLKLVKLRALIMRVMFRYAFEISEEIPLIATDRCVKLTARTKWGLKHKSQEWDLRKACSRNVHQ